MLQEVVLIGFDLDFLTNTMNYIPVSVENQVNVDAGTQELYVAGLSEKDKEPTQEYILLPLHPQGKDFSRRYKPLKKKRRRQLRLPVLTNLILMKKMGAEADFNNMDNTIDVSPILTLRVHKDHPKGFFDTAHPNKVYKVIKALYGLHQAPRACLCVLSLKIVCTKDYSQDKYVADILKKFDFCSIKTVTTPIASNKPLVKDEDGVDVDVYVYRSMIGSLMYVTTSRPDIMFDVCSCARDSPFELEAFSDSDYEGASLDRKSTTGGYQFLGRRLISWQCKKQTIVENSTTEAEYVAATNYCQHLVLLGLVCAAQKYFTMEMLFGLGKKLLLGLVLEAINGKFDAAKQIWCCQANLVLPGKISMANLEFVDQHNMVACLEKTEGNSNFHEIVDFIASSLIHHALTINATVDSKAVVVIEASIRSSFLFNDADGTACLTNEAIFQNLALMGYEAPEGEGSDQPTKPQPTPSPTHPSIGDQPLVLALESIKDAQAAEISALKSRIKKLEKKCKPSISHHRAWLKIVDEGRKSGEIEEVKLTDDTKVVEDKGSGDKGGNTEELVSTAKPEVSTARPNVDAARKEDSAVKPRTPPTTTSIFEDEDITMAQTLIKMKEEKAKEKGVLIKDVKDSFKTCKINLNPEATSNN
ncbi:hypothetical protein Tco_0390447 [Tanacetum coccineum]